MYWVLPAVYFHLFIFVSSSPSPCLNVQTWFEQGMHYLPFKSQPLQNTLNRESPFPNARIQLLYSGCNVSDTANCRYSAYVLPDPSGLELLVLAPSDPDIVDGAVFDIRGFRESDGEVMCEQSVRATLLDNRPPRPCTKSLPIVREGTVGLQDTLKIYTWDYRNEKRDSPLPVFCPTDSKINCSLPQCGDLNAQQKIHSTVRLTSPLTRGLPLSLPVQLTCPTENEAACVTCAQHLVQNERPASLLVQIGRTDRHRMGQNLRKTVVVAAIEDDDDTLDDKLFDSSQCSACSGRLRVGRDGRMESETELGDGFLAENIRVSEDGKSYAETRQATVNVSIRSLPPPAILLHNALPVHLKGINAAEFLERPQKFESMVKRALRLNPKCPKPHFSVVNVRNVSGGLNFEEKTSSKGLHCFLGSYDPVFVTEVWILAGCTADRYLTRTEVSYRLAHFQSQVPDTWPGVDVIHVTVIRNLLGLFEAKRGKVNKAVIAKCDHEYCVKAIGTGTTTDQHVTVVAYDCSDPGGCGGADRATIQIQATGQDVKATVAQGPVLTSSVSTPFTNPATVQLALTPSSMLLRANQRWSQTKVFELVKHGITWPSVNFGKSDGQASFSGCVGLIQLDGGEPLDLSNMPGVSLGCDYADWIEYGDCDSCPPGTVCGERYHVWGCWCPDPEAALYNQYGWLQGCAGAVVQAGGEGGGPNLLWLLLLIPLLLLLCLLCCCLMLCWRRRKPKEVKVQAVPVKTAPLTLVPPEGSIGQPDANAGGEKDNYSYNIAPIRVKENKKINPHRKIRFLNGTNGAKDDLRRYAIEGSARNSLATNLSSLSDDMSEPRAAYLDTQLRDLLRDFSADNV